HTPHSAHAEPYLKINPLTLRLPPTRLNRRAPKTRPRRTAPVENSRERACEEVSCPSRGQPRTSPRSSTVPRSPGSRRPLLPRQYRQVRGLLPNPAHHQIAEPPPPHP